MRGSLRPVVERYARQTSTVFAALSGMTATALFPGAFGTAPRPIEYLYATILFGVTIGMGVITIWAAKGETVRWTITEMIAFFAIGIIAMLALAHNV
jgi:hypothetical protein